jgi:hypothetical protein
MMHKNLVLLAFQKARKERRKIGDNKPSLKKVAEDLAAEIDYKVGERSLRDYYNNAKKLNGNSQDVNIGQLTVVDRLSKYLGFSDYEEFTSSMVQPPVEDHSTPSTVHKSVEKEDKKSVIIIKDGQQNPEPRPEIQIKNSNPKSDKNIKIWLKRNKSIVIIIPFILH